LEKLQQTHDVQIRWRSFELRPAGSPPISPEYLERIKQGQPMLRARMKDDHNIELNSGPFGINSRPALILDKYAEAEGKGEAFHNVTQAAYWLEAQDISSHAVLKGLMEKAGLDPNQLDAVLSDPRYEAEVDEDIALAREYGLNGVPALVFNNKYLVSGAQPYAMLARAVEQIQAE
jgi:predicted DsbA family dithiol-disulfide isomerase